MASPQDQRAKCFTSYFKCDLSDHIITVSPITARFPALECSDGRHYQYKVCQPGQPTYGNIVFEILEHKDSFPKIKSWVKDCYDGKETRKDISLEIFDQAKDTVRTFNFMDCFPVSLDYLNLGAAGSSGSVNRARLEIRVNRIDMA
jgi:phage tail-like protein